MDQTLYQYTRLPTARSIRLLDIMRIWADLELHELRGHLRIVSLDENPEYEAISYTWGDTALCQYILIDDCRLPITANCAAALRRMLRGKFRRTVWIDAVCIDQATDPDALRERSQQVQMMDRIYEQAQRVNVYLGEGDAESDAAAVMLKKLFLAFLTWKRSPIFQETGRREYERLAAEAIETSEQRPYGVLHGIFKFPWFQRVWTLQEVAMARFVMFYCGEYLLAMETILFGTYFTTFGGPQTVACSQFWGGTIIMYSRLQNWVAQKRRGEPLTNITLFEILQTASFNNATLPEDKIYAVYGICRYLGFQLPRPDYQKPLRMLYTEATRCILEQDQSLEALSEIVGSSAEKGLPSWVLDFSNVFEPDSPKITVPIWRSFQAAGESSVCFHLSPDGQKLHVRGRRFDRISRCGSFYQFDMTHHAFSASPVVTDKNFQSFIRFLQDWGKFTEQVGEYPTGESLETAFARTVSCNRFNDQVISVQLLDKVSQVISLIVAGAEDLASGQNPYGLLLSPELHGIFEGVATQSARKRMLATEFLYLGMAPGSVQPGDLLVVLYGCRAPFVIREVEGGYYLMGPAYIHGVMNKEFWDISSPSDDEWFTLV